MMFITPAHLDAVTAMQGVRSEATMTVARLIADAQQNLPLLKSDVLPRGLDRQDVAEAVRYVKVHADRSSYHLLFAILRTAPREYEALDAGVKAAILCDALRHVQFLNDWGYLDPSESHDGEAAVALLDLGRDALGPLRPLLSDANPAPLYGSETATQSSTYKFRRQDFAYRYAMLILKRPAVFDADPLERDRRIASLKAELARKPSSTP